MNQEILQIFLLVSLGVLFLLSLIILMLHLNLRKKFLKTQEENHRDHQTLNKNQKLLKEVLQSTLMIQSKEQAKLSNLDNQLRLILTQVKQNQLPAKELELKLSQAHQEIQSLQEQKKEIVMQMKKYLKEPKHIDTNKSEQTLSKDQNKLQESQYPYTTI